MLSTTKSSIGYSEPEYRGTLTIRYVYDAESKAEFAARAHEWAREVWEAYALQHELARNWIRKAIGRGIVH